MDLEEIRRKKREELEAGLAQQQQVQEQVEQIEAIAKQWLTKDALSRFGTLKQAHPEKAVQFAAAIVHGVQSGQIREPVSDELMKEILRQMEPEKRNTIIRRK